MGAAMVPLDRALLSFYRLSIVTIPPSVTVWSQFAMQILTGVPTPKSPLPVMDWGPCLVIIIVSIIIIIIIIKFVHTVHQQTERQTDEQTDRG